jgi:hypothetical protein
MTEGTYLPSRSDPHALGAPDPTLATNERLEAARLQLEQLISRNREEAKGWVNSLQVLLEKSLAGEIKNIETRLSGGDIALTAAMRAADAKAEQQAQNFSAILSEAKVSISKQLDNLNEKIDGLKTSVSTGGGHQQGASHGMALIISLFALAAAVAAAIGSLFRVH